MDGREIVTRIIEGGDAPRIGFDFTPPYPSDVRFVRGARLIPHTGHPEAHYGWGRHEALLRQVPWFSGEVRVDVHGNVHGRLNGITKGECVKGWLDGWDKLGSAAMPTLDEGYFGKVAVDADRSLFTVAGLPMNVFSDLRDARLMANALADTALEPGRVAEYLEAVVKVDVRACEGLAGKGVDGVMLTDDWGTQDRTFISPESFVRLFKPAYARICDAAHGAGMKVLMHSCGQNRGFVRHLIEAGVDVLQFDQPDAYPAGWLAETFAGMAAFYMPADIQKVMPTGDRGLIERSAAGMAVAFREAGCGLIAKDYPSWADIGVSEEWAGWARDAFIGNAWHGRGAKGA
ncbi:MAG: hypothetical protein FWE70_03080 [Oscillospiraceae bacterium]|nr:hypothetical protein [Oscillospiraceae bacterium]